MVALLIATRNEGKQRELRRLLTGAAFEFVFPDDIGVWTDPAEDQLELHDTFQANARAKAEYFARLTGRPTVAEDSGLEVFALDGAPGVRSKRWAGATGSSAEIDVANNTMLLRRLSGAPPARRRARYRCAAVLLRRPGGISEYFDGACNGTIATEPKGSRGFGYDPLFVSDELEKTFAEATDEEKDRVSHRARAVLALRQALERHPLP